jgi:hypothetical protein
MGRFALVRPPLKRRLFGPSIVLGALLAGLTGVASANAADFSYPEGYQTPYYGGYEGPYGSRPHYYEPRPVYGSRHGCWEWGCDPAVVQRRVIVAPRHPYVERRYVEREYVERRYSSEWHDHDRDLGYGYGEVPRPPAPIPPRASFYYYDDGR